MAFYKDRFFNFKDVIMAASSSLCLGSPVFVPTQIGSASDSIIEYHSLFKSSVWEYSIEDVLELERLRKFLKKRVGNKSSQYLELKAKLSEVKLAHLPFRVYEMWKQRSSALGSDVSLKKRFFEQQELDSKLKADRQNAKAILYYSLSPATKAKLQRLSRVQWIHGSSTSALALMVHLNPSAPSLVHTGALLNEGICPMYGEMRNGCSLRGINQRALSAETIRNIPRIMEYAKMTPFDPTELTLRTHHPHAFILYFWKEEEFNDFCFWSRQESVEFDRMFPAGSQQTLELIDALEVHKLKRGESFQPPITAMISCLKREEFGPVACKASHFSLNGKFNAIANPYEYLVNIDNWGNVILQMMQFKQWDYEVFCKQMAPYLHQWEAALEKKYCDLVDPLNLLIKIADHDFTEDEIAFIQSYQLNPNSDISLLASIFPSKDLIPMRFFRSDFDPSEIEPEILSCINGYGTYMRLINRALGWKLDKPDGLMIEEIKKSAAKNLDAINRSYQRYRQALSLTPPRLAISQDPALHSHLLSPSPIIYASTQVKAESFSKGDENPCEFILPHPVPLGKGGADIIFTDNEDSKERIKALLPPHLQEEISILLFEELQVRTSQVGSKDQEIDLPLVHAPFQVII